MIKVNEKNIQNQARPVGTLKEPSPKSLSEMKRSIYKEPKLVLVFGGSKVLNAKCCSLSFAARFSQRNLQAISFCCTGKYISTGGYYFRHLHPDIEVPDSDIGKLTIDEYDKLCGATRRYHSVREMYRRRMLHEKK